MGKARLERAVSRGYRNWRTRFGEDFGRMTTLSDLSPETLTFLARGGEKGTFYLYDLIMNVLDLGSGFEFHELGSAAKRSVLDIHLFLLDRVRFEYMKRIGWVDTYPGEETPLVELILQFEETGANLQAVLPSLGRGHADYDRFSAMATFEKDEFMRKLMAKAIQGMADHSTTL
jgi:hypothetical protein